MTITVVLPPGPRPVPPLSVDPAGIRACGADLLAASAQVDDLGSFAAGSARIGDWSGDAADAYHRTIRPLGRTADAMSLALRGVARRVDAHAEAMDELVRRRWSLVDERTLLLDTVEDLRHRVATATAPDAPGLQAECDDVARRVRAHAAEVDRWTTDLMAEEEGMRAAFDRVLTLEQVEQRYGGAGDPADDALATRPGGDADPAEVKAWWDGLTRQQQLAVIAAAPGAIGNLDGIPPWARDAANTVALHRDLAEWGHLEDLGELTESERTWLDNARAAQDAIDLITEGTDPVTNLPVPAQLYLYDPGAFDGDGAIAVAAGDLGTADNVAVVVPGFGTDGESAPYQAERVLTLHESCRYLAPEETNATMFWIGYDAPDNLPWDEGWDGAGVVGEAMAERGGERLADLLEGLRESRDGSPAHLTAIGHSYGSTTAGHAAHDHGIPVDDLVLVGSPGAGGDTDTARDLGLDPGHVWAGANSRDPIADLGNHGAFHLEVLAGGGLGDDPAEDDFGAVRFQAESTTRSDDDGLGAFGDHSKYFDHDTESLHNISQIVNGSYDQVGVAGHVRDPWWGDPRDPEWDRDPTSPATRADS